MKTNEKILGLISYGLKPSWVMSLNESQIDGLHKRMVKSKKETNEIETVQKTVNVMKVKPNELQNFKSPDGTYTIPLAKEGEMRENGEMTEKSVSKQQQK